MAQYTKSATRYTKSTNTLVASLKFVPYDEFEFNILGAETDNGHLLRICDGDMSTTNINHTQWGFEVYDTGIVGRNTTYCLQQYIDGMEDSSTLVYYTSFRGAAGLTQTTETVDGIDRTRYTFSKAPVFKLYVYSYMGADKCYYAKRIFDKSVTFLEGQAYSLEGPSMLFEEAMKETTAIGADLGNNWVKISEDEFGSY